MPLRLLITCLLCIIAALQPCARASQTSLVRFYTDDFWLNLHHYLYVLGRAEAQMVDATRPEVAGAPKEQAQGLSGLSPQEQQNWREAVSAYAAKWSRRDTVFDADLVAITR